MTLLKARQSRGGAWVAAGQHARPSGTDLRSRFVSHGDDAEPVRFDEPPPEPVSGHEWDGVALPASRLRSARAFALPAGSRWGRELSLAAAGAILVTGALAAMSGSFTTAPPGVVEAEAPARVAMLATTRMPAAPLSVAEARQDASTKPSAAAQASVTPPSRPSRDIASVLLQGGPDTTASFVTPPARPKGLGPGSESAKIRTARLDEGGPAPQLLRQASPRAAGGIRQSITKLVGFDTAPFPYDGTLPGTQDPFLNTEQGEDRGHRSARGRLFLEQETFSDNRVLTHIPSGFDLERPGVMVVFFHGHGATLKRDVQNRQQVPAQITASGANAVLVAPQFAVDASDSSAGRFWEQGGFGRFLDESAKQLARLHGGGDEAVQRFSAMPVVIVAYSGGFVPAAYALQAGGVRDRVRGVVLLDAIYGEHEKFANWMAGSKNGFLVNASTNYTKGSSVGLERLLAARDVPVGTELKPNLSRGGAVFLSTGGEHSHRDYVTQAWTAKPIADILSRLPEYRLRGGGDAVASLDGGSRKQRSAAASPQ